MRAAGVLAAAVGFAGCLFGIGLFVKAGSGGYESPWYALVLVGLIILAFGAAFLLVAVRLLRRN